MMSNEDNTNKLDINDPLAGLSPEERAYAWKILNELKTDGESQLLDDLKYGDFEEIPVDIDTFLDGKEYLRAGLWEHDKLTGEEKCTLFPYWRETLKKLFPDNLTTAYNTLILTGAIGLGKAQPLDSLVFTEQGYKKMGELTLSDKAYGNDGKLHDIVGIFPQGKKKICKVSFTDGTSTLCCDEHLWTVYNTKNQVWTTVETKQLIDGSRNLQHSYGHRYKIPMTKPIDFPKNVLSIDPYILGVLIGDGSLTSSVQFASADQEIIDTIKSKLPDSYYVTKLAEKYSYSITTDYVRNTSGQFTHTNDYLQYIRQIGLNKKAEHKFIPKEFLFSAVDDRIELLQGLMDTDGSISKDGARVEYCTVSEQLKTDFVQLVQSLGGTAKVRIKQTSYKDTLGNKKECKPAYLIGIKLPKSICPFKLTRKACRLSDKRLEPFRYITNIEYVGEDECQCIYINSDDHLYLTNDLIVTHNTLMGCLAMLYLLYRMLCLKDPYSYYGMMPSDKITFSMLNITLDAAQGVGWDKMQQLLQASPWFMEHGSLNASRSNPQWQPPKGIELIFGSNNRHIVGRALFSNLTDEVNFGVGNNVERQKAKQKKMISQIDSRMVSRFGKGTYLPTLNIIISSKDVEQAFLNSYIEQKRNDATTLIIDEPQWVVRPDKGSVNDPGAFYVAIGNKFLANELLPVDATNEIIAAYRAKGYNLLKVPPIYRVGFETNLEQHLMDDAGYSIASVIKYISGERLMQAKTDLYENPFTKDVIETGNGELDNFQYKDWFDLTKVSPADKARPLFIHLDMSKGGGNHNKTNDKTGIAGVWITGKQAGIDGAESLQYKLAFSVSVQAPKGTQISFTKTVNFVKWLRDMGFAIKGVSSDTFQSAQTLQELKAFGFRTTEQSVDRIDTKTHLCVPYAFFKSCIYEKKLKMYRKSDLLDTELTELERESDGHINHPDNGKYGSKDQADAVCGALYLASQFAEEYSYSYGESIDASLDVSCAASAEETKLQMMNAFEEELSKFYGGFGKSIKEADIENKVDQDYQDFLDGIICI